MGNTELIIINKLYIDKIILSYNIMKKKGGSIASNKVNSLVSKSHNLNRSEYPTHEISPINRCFSINNYSSVYKTTGGKTSPRFPNL